MLIFNVDLPLSQQQIQQDNIAEKQGIITYFSKMLKFGIAFLLVGITVISVYGFPPIKTEDPYRLYLLTYMIWIWLTSALIMLPLMFKGRILALLDSKYWQAGLEKIHNCNAYLNMPGMETHKHYAQNIRQQGRELTNFECDEIIQFWNSQIAINKKI